MSKFTEAFSGDNYRWDERIAQLLRSKIYGENSVAIYMSAVSVDPYDVDEVLKDVLMSIVSSKFHNEDTTSEEVAENFCELIYTDYALIEALLGFNFSDLDSMNEYQIMNIIDQL